MWDLLLCSDILRCDSNKPQGMVPDRDCSWQDKFATFSNTSHLYSFSKHFGFYYKMEDCVEWFTCVLFQNIDDDVGLLASFYMLHDDTVG